jgi:hypothetical protein
MRKYVLKEIMEEGAEAAVVISGAISQTIYSHVFIMR